jgi:hypothetical protein
MRPGATAVCRFPNVDFRSHAEFEKYRKDHSRLLDTRWLFERSLASTDPEIGTEGTCGICLAPARFTAATVGGEETGTGRVPNWREALNCDCELRLINRERALVHRILALGSIDLFRRVLQVGGHGGLRGALSALGATVTVCSRLARDNGAAGAWRYRPPASPGGIDVVVYPDASNVMPLDRPGLALVYNLLAPGGRFMFTAPFDITSNAPAANASIGASGPINWSILDLLGEAGFTDRVASLYWSEEMGYMGAFNFVFVAAK